ncbi:hypothetical protein T440DRAFT_188875 [Plenodomus tracheiphilus IPT5]|uniref:Secreted protein n=1 Tax=Plenodomus tracheiphilus IPT5 TaxID=1408161 RepID=A0A6A7AW88_9PLEO|nr:hypothetical protein T440DRAFT_188875 [Plenodomus tracheiphilus IPT5]
MQAPLPMLLIIAALPSFQDLELPSPSVSTALGMTTERAHLRMELSPPCRPCWPMDGSRNHSKMAFRRNSPLKLTPLEIKCRA